MRGRGPASVRTQKVAPATASVRQAKNPGSEEHRQNIKTPDEQAKFLAERWEALDTEQSGGL